MGVYVTGDIRGIPNRLNTDYFPEQKQFSGNKKRKYCYYFRGFWSCVESRRRI